MVRNGTVRIMHFCAKMVRRSGLLRATLVGAACFVGLVAVFHKSLTAYYPLQDEISFIVNSTPLTDQFKPEEWITKGYSNYCCPYPEWSTPRYNYIRPVVNACYYLNWNLWGRSWGKYLYLHWAVLAIGAALAFYIADVCLNCPRWLAMIVAVLMASSPGNTAGLTLPNFATDALCGVFAGIAFIALIRKRTFWVVVAMTLAMFTKEIVVWLPFAAAATVILRELYGEKQAWQRRILLLAALFTPLMVWAAVRFLAFGSTVGGVSQAPQSGLKGNALNLCYCLLNWPLGLAGTALDPCGSVRALVLRDWAGISWPAVVAGLFNMLLVAWALAGSARWLLQNRSRQGLPVISALLVWIAASASLILVLGLGTRHGYILYLLGLPLTAYALSRAIAARRVIASMCIVLAVATASSLYLYAVHRDYDSLYNETAEMARSMVERVGEAGQRFEAVYVLNDIGVQTSCGSLGPFVGSPVPVVAVNSIQKAALDPAEQRSKPGMPAMPTLDIRPQSSGVTTIAVDLGDAWRFSFPCVSPAVMFPQSGVPLAVRNEQMRYEFPELGRETGVSGMVRLSFGRKMVVQLSDTRNFGIVYFDAKSRTYRIAGKGEAVHLSIPLSARQ